MRFVVALSAVAAITAGCAAPHVSADPIPAAPVNAQSHFCDLAEQIGRRNLGMVDTDDDVDTATVLHNIDLLDAAAPADLKADMDSFDAFEHATLDPGTVGSQYRPGGANTHQALQHVADYLRDQCHV